MACCRSTCRTRGPPAARSPTAALRCCAPPSPASRPTSASPSRAASGSTCAGGQVRSRASSCGPICGSGARPTFELSLGGASLSREHAALRLEAIAAAAGSSAHGLDEVELAVALVDLGSRAGTFWRGETLAPGEPVALEGPGELTLGLSAARIEVHPLPRERGELGALLRPQGQGAASPWTLYLPGGGPLWLAPDRPIPAVLELRPPFIAVRIAAGVRAQLGQEPLGPGASIELLHGDRLHLDLPDGRLTLEISMT
ncbi:FHA domain-containing protein [Nannocystis pusilla]|uniref:FHA domain-containing protein n=1 Tax=Nannocystis pusilla TaxID=889268 RepID=UPI003DA1FB73